MIHDLLSKAIGAKGCSKMYFLPFFGHILAILDDFQNEKEKNDKMKKLFIPIWGLASF